MAYKYLSYNTLVLYVDERDLIQLSNDDDTVDPLVDPADDDILEAAENAAGYTIDNYLRLVYTIPLAGGDLTTEIVEIIARLTLTNMWKRRSWEPDRITAEREELFVRLDDIRLRQKELRDNALKAKAGSAR